MNEPLDTDGKLFVNTPTVQPICSQQKPNPNNGELPPVFQLFWKCLACGYVWPDKQKDGKAIILSKGFVHA